jgi:hypothetical protein
VIDYESRSETFEIIPLGDVHLGAKACDEKLLSEKIEYIRYSPSCYWVGLGDMMDCISRHDKRHQEATLAPWLCGKNPILKIQRDLLIDLLKPISDKCIGYTKGNHELAVEEDLSADAYLDVIEALDTKHDIRLDMCGWINLKFRRCNKGGTTTVKMFIHHGWSGGDLMGGVALKLERLPSVYDADIYMLGHLHKLICFPSVFLGTDRSGTVVSRTRYSVCTGSFLKTALEDATTYAERKGLKPVSLGTAKITITPGAESNPIRVEI